MVRGQRGTKRDADAHRAAVFQQLVRHLPRPIAGVFVPHANGRVTAPGDDGPVGEHDDAVHLARVPLQRRAKREVAVGAALGSNPAGGFLTRPSGKSSGAYACTSAHSARPSANDVVASVIATP